jgi:putative membrane protein insertion efficiency factor
MRTAEGAPDRLEPTLPVKIAVGAIAFYKRFLSPLLPPACRFRPTCSEFASEAVQRHGFRRGSALSIRRLLRCHPFHPGGYDPVP